MTALIFIMAGAVIIQCTFSVFFMGVMLIRLFDKRVIPLGKRKDSKTFADEELEDAKRKLFEETEAFKEMMSYNADVAYGRGSYVKGEKSDE